MRFLLSKLRIFLFFPIPYLSQPLYPFHPFCRLLFNRRSGYNRKYKECEIHEAIPDGNRLPVDDERLNVSGLLVVCLLPRDYKDSVSQES